MRPYTQTGVKPCKRKFNCRRETNPIDFELVTIELPNPNYSSHALNSQQDVRLFVASAYFKWCVSAKTLMLLHDGHGHMNAYARTIADIVDLGCAQFPRQRSISADFQQWFTDFLKTPGMGAPARLNAHYAPFLRTHRRLWRDVWTMGDMPLLTRFQYDYALPIDDTPCSEPSAVLSLVAGSWPSSKLQ